MTDWCSRCGKEPKDPDSKWGKCTTCTNYGKAVYERNKASSSARLRLWKDGNEEHKAQQSGWRAENAAKRRQDEKERRLRLREEVFTHYGDFCVCCREGRKDRLCIDHEDGGGNKHRKEVGGGTAFFWWLKRSGFPPGFRVLCHNCNACVASNGRCVHENGVSRPEIKRSPRFGYMRGLRRKTRLEVLIRYSEGGVIACRACSEKRFDFLCLDHIEGGGKQHRKEVGRGSTFYRWIKEAGYPDGYQVLCYDCNAVKA